MKKVITMVGTSLFENYRKYLNENNVTSANFKDNYETIHDDNPLYEEGDNYSTKINRLKEEMIRYFNNTSNNKNISAEIKSLIQIQKMIGDNLDVYLFASDSVLSVLASELIKKYFEDYLRNDNIFVKEIRVIKGLQIKDSEKFTKEGLPELTNQIYNVAGYYWDNVIFNITGGYKVSIPYLTIMAQVNKCDTYYIFENTDNLIKIKPIPVSFEYSNLFEKYIEKLLDIEEKTLIDYDENFYNDCNSFLEKDNNNKITLNNLGLILWEKYKDDNKLYRFYAPEDVYNEILRQENIKRILKEKFFRGIYSDKTETKESHTVYDDGNNQNRIYYFREKNRIYIYKTFEDHDASDRYIKKYTLNKNNVIKNSKPFLTNF